MKSLWNSFKAAFAMFSKIPMPMVDWNCLLYTSDAADE